MSKRTPHPPELLGALLREVSRSFYTTLRVLPSAVRQPIGLAYLLARATDTIADTEIVPLEERLAALEQLRARILGQGGARLDFEKFARANLELRAAGSTSSERTLLNRIEEALQLLARLSEEDRRDIRQVLDTITSGQQLDLRRFGSGARPACIVPLQTAVELEDYTYRVAGCVGEFWTRMCRRHLFPRARLDESRLFDDGVRFGKGLQLVNILRDLPADLRKGRCYLPEVELNAIGLTPPDLLEPRNEPRLRPLYDHWLNQAECYLRAGWDYTNSLPWRCVRVRLACAWPVLIGIGTLRQLRAGNVLDASHRLKISRPQVRKIMARTLVFYPFPTQWRSLIDGSHSGKSV